MLVLIVACAEETVTGVTPMTAGPGFFDTPFPADARMKDGHPDFTNFPHEGQFPLVDAYLAAANQVAGWATNGPVYVRFEEPIDTALLPTSEDSVRLDSPILLLDVDRTSPHRGERVPLQFQYWDIGTSWTPENLLAAAPVYGFPLRPATTYALLLRRPLAAPGEASVFGADADPTYASTEETLLGLSVDPDSISLAVVFTTQDPTADVARIAETIHDEMGVPALGQAVTLVDTRSQYSLYTGDVVMPIWQEGERPYRSVGGALRMDAEGDPVLFAWERVQFALSIPEGEMPDGGWPVVLYSHGTGGDQFTFCRTGANDEEATVMARVGVAMIGVSQPLHGDRATPDTNVDLDSFNFYNPDAGRSNFRQGALDQVYLAEALTRNQPVFTHDGEQIRLDPRRVAYFGHSQGGLVGAIAAPFLAEDVIAAGFSGTGGGLPMTITLRKDPLDIALLVSAMLQFGDDDTLTNLHPVLAVIQTLVEVTDPLNYAPYWFAEIHPSGSRPLPILLTEGLEDQATPSLTTEALAAAARAPIVGEPATDPEGLRLRGLEPHNLPSQNDAVDWERDPITAGLGQYPDRDHYAIYEDADARRLYRNFLESSLAGSPELDE